MQGKKLSSQNHSTFFAHMANCLKSVIYKQADIVNISVCDMIRIMADCLKSVIYKQADMVNIATRDLITIKTIALGDKTICDLVNRLI